MVRQPDSSLPCSQPALDTSGEARLQRMSDSDRRQDELLSNKSSPELFMWLVCSYFNYKYSICPELRQSSQKTSDNTSSIKYDWVSWKSLIKVISDVFWTVIQEAQFPETLVLLMRLMAVTYKLRKHLWTKI